VQGDTAPKRNNSTWRRSEPPRRDEREMEEGGTQLLVTAILPPSPIGPLHGCRTTYRRPLQSAGPLRWARLLPGGGRQEL